MCSAWCSEDSPNLFAHCLACRSVSGCGATFTTFYAVIEMSPSISTWSVKTASPGSGSTRFVFKAVEA
jgi:hypothetical protein